MLKVFVRECKVKNITEEELAEFLEVSTPEVKDIISMKISLKLCDAEGICHYYFKGYTVYELFPEAFAGLHY
jgi:transcriptional regulator with XRE-family HTH domain